jgi:hypothetical protein
MKNLDESRKREDASQGEVIAIKSRDARPEGPQPLLPQQQIDLLREQWATIQTAFIDEPRRSVKDADALVASATRQLAEAFTNQRSQLEKQWSQGDQISTEDLRLALQQYRSFFSRLLSM